MRLVDHLKCNKRQQETTGETLKENRDEEGELLESPDWSVGWKKSV